MTISNLIRWHRLLLWLGGATLLIFALTGISHPIMSWTGPQAVTMRPPSLQLTGTQLTQAMQQLSAQALPAQALVKLVPYRDEVVLQLSSDLSSPRQYLPLQGPLNTETAPSDQDMAVWLAGHYSGLPADQVQQVRFQTEFDDAYPSVNRLLPVYQVDYQSGLSLFIHTESLSLAGITNPYKTTLQSVFRQFHSWQWLDATPTLKIVVMTLLLGSALLLVLTGAWLLFKLPSKAKRRGLRRWHYLLSWALFVPVLLYLLTGIYHFAYKQVAPETAGLTLPKPQPLPTGTLATPTLPSGVPASGVLDSGALYNSATLVWMDSQWYWRLSSANPALQADRQSRYQGQPSEQGATYIALTAAQDVTAAADGAVTPTAGQTLGTIEPETAGIAASTDIDDQRYAMWLAQQYTGLAASELRGKLVTHFGPDYDFRNKRLPVWQFDYASGRVFVDAVSGQLIEEQSRASQWERYSFSFVHKWGILQPLLGREGRDGVVVVIMLLVISMAVLGLLLRLRRR